MRVALLCCQWETAAEAGMIFGVPQNNNSALHVYFPSVIPDNV